MILCHNESTSYSLSLLLVGARASSVFAGCLSGATGTSIGSFTPSPFIVTCSSCTASDCLTLFLAFLT